MTLIAALKWLAKDLGDNRKLSKITIFGDSKLVVSQVTGVWKVKNANMIPLVKEAKELFREFGSCSIEWHPRAKSVERLGH
jgi:ribonuclease HI